MKIEQLINILSSYDPEAEVRIMSQESYPFEYRISHVLGREAFEELEESDPQSRVKHPNDVFIVEGDQICYGNKDAW